MMLSLRSVLIWGFSLCTHYFWDSSAAVGEAWTSRSFMQLAGFGAQIIGQMVHGGVLEVPGLRYPPPECKCEPPDQQASMEVCNPQCRNVVLSQRMTREA